MPNGGYGMNAGIADAANLSWMIAATLRGWASPAILDAYEAERQPITEQVSRFTTDVALQDHDSSGARYPPKSNGRGRSAMPRARESARRPTTSTSTSNAPAASISDISMRARRSLPTTASRIPPTRCTISRRRRFPAAGHRTCGSSDGRSLYDALGADYTLIRLDPTVRVAGMVEAAARRSVPLAVLDVDAPDARAALCAQARARASRPARGMARRRRAGRSDGLDRSRAWRSLRVGLQGGVTSAYGPALTTFAAQQSGSFLGLSGRACRASAWLSLTPSRSGGASRQSITSSARASKYRRHF